MAYLAGYDPAAYPPFAVTVDLVVLTVADDALRVLTVRRAEPPFTGQLALPGGFVRPDEGLIEAARRELAEETGLVAVQLYPGVSSSSEAPGLEQLGHLEQLASYGDVARDPRMRVVSVAYLAFAPDLPRPVAGGDAGTAQFVPVAELLKGPPLAFDHDRILADGVERARAKLEYTTLATAFCPPVFTVAQLRRIYDLVWDVELDPRNFHRKVTGVPGFLELATPGGRSAVGREIGSAVGPNVGRPAQHYRAGTATTLHPPILRPPPEQPS